jgi:hypothetical protein
MVADRQESAPRLRRVPGRAPQSLSPLACRILGRTGAHRAGESAGEEDLKRAAKPLNEIQWVQVPSGQSLAGRPVTSVAIRRATGGCEAYTVRKQAVKTQLRKLLPSRMPTPLGRRKAVPGQPICEEDWGSPESLARGMLSKGFPVNPGELTISSREGGNRPSRETGDGRDGWASSLTTP